MDQAALQMVAPLQAMDLETQCALCQHPVDRTFQCLLCLSETFCSEKCWREHSEGCASQVRFSKILLGLQLSGVDSRHVICIQDVPSLWKASCGWSTKVFVVVEITEVLESSRFMVRVRDKTGDTAVVKFFIEDNACPDGSIVMLEHILIPKLFFHVRAPFWCKLPGGNKAIRIDDIHNVKFY